jgi:hypothetical protein
MHMSMILYGARDRARTRAVEVMDVMDVDISYVAQMTFLAHETLHMSSLDPTNGMLCVGCAQNTLGGALGRSWGVL